VRLSDTGTGPAVVLLHGLFLDRTTWDPLSDSLATNHRVIAPDLPGFGASEKPPASRFGYHVEAFAEAIADVFAALELGRAAVVGHCLGGAVALVLAARHPELVAKLILVDALCDTPRLGRFGRLGLTPLVGGFVFKQVWGKGVFRALFRERIAPDAGQHHDRIDRYYDTFREPSARASALEVLRAVQDPRPLVARTPGVRAPTLVVWGTHDRVIPVLSGRRLAREISGARLELLSTGHSPQEDASAALSVAVRRFLLE